MSDSEPKAWFLKMEEEPGATGASESSAEEVQMSEAQLERELRRAGDRLRLMYVRQAGSDWYPAKVVLKKFDQLAQEGIYIRHDGEVQGPFTAMKSIQVLGEMELAWTEAKIGIHSDWISAERLLRKLKKLREKRSDAKRAANSDSTIADSGQMPEGTEAGSDSRPRIVGLEALLSADDTVDADRHVAPSAEDVADGSESDAPETETVASYAGAPVASTGSSGAMESEPVEPDSNETFETEPNSESALELVLVAEPVIDPVAPVPAPPPVKRSVVDQALDPVTVSPREAVPQRPVRSTAASRSGNRSGSMVLVGGVATLAIGSVIGIAALIYFLQDSSNSEVAGSNEVDWTAVSDVDVQSETNSPSNPPQVSPGTLFRPSISTTFGDANGGTLFAARVGRSNRMVLVGAAHLLGPATGLPRQLRGAEFDMFFQGLRTIDCVSGRAFEVTGKPVRLRTAEYPSISAHGDALAFEPDANIGLQPLQVTTSVPETGDTIWLLAPARGTDQLAHSGRWIGKEKDWYLYRLDNQALDLVGTSGGAVVNRDHEVVGIHVAGGETSDGVISIASPIQPIISEIR